MKWEKLRLSELCISIADGDHQSMPVSKSGIPFIVIANIRNNTVDFSKSRFVPNSYYEKLEERRKPRKGDVIYSVKGSFGIPVYVNTDQPFTFQRDIAIIKCNEKMNSHFLYYVLKSEEYYRIADSLAIGAAQRALTLKTLNNLPIPCPPIETQNKIVRILSAYDNLIENNQKQIKLLEEAAQRLYKEWFVDLHFPGWESAEIVDGVPVGWKKVSIDDLGEYINGFAFKPSDWHTIGKPIIKIKEMNEGVTKDTPRNSGNSIPEKYNVSEGDILFSWSATLAVIIWHSEEGLLNQHLYKVVPHQNYCREFVYQSLFYSIPSFQNLTTGATMKHLQRGKLKDVCLLAPTNSIMRQFNEVADPYRMMLLTLEKRIASLKEARDRLLPKLMSGENEV